MFGYFQAENEEGDGDEISVFTVSKRKKIGEAAGKGVGLYRWKYRWPSG